MNAIKWTEISKKAPSLMKRLGRSHGQLNLIQAVQSWKLEESILGLLQQNVPVHEIHRLTGISTDRLLEAKDDLRKGVFA